MIGKPNYALHPRFHKRPTVIVTEGTAHTSHRPCSEHCCSVTVGNAVISHGTHLHRPERSDGPSVATTTTLPKGPTCTYRGVVVSGQDTGHGGSGDGVPAEAQLVRFVLEHRGHLVPQHRHSQNARVVGQRGHATVKGPQGNLGYKMADRSVSGPVQDCRGLKCGFLARPFFRG